MQTLQRNRCQTRTRLRKKACVYGAFVSGVSVGEYGNGGSQSTGRLEYLWLPTDSGQAIPIGLYKDNRFYAIHSDHLGTPRQITDDTNKVVWQWAYSAFGENKPTGVLQATANPNAALANQPAVLLKATTPSITVNLRFPGQYADEESNLFENGFRSYRPGMGDYTQFDPIGLDGGWNRRGYVGGNSLWAIDPLGLLPSCKWVGIALVCTLGPPPGVDPDLPPSQNYTPAPPNPTGTLCLLSPVTCAITAAAQAVVDACAPKSHEKNCAALKASIQATCASLTGSKKAACFVAAETAYQQCLSQK